MMGRGSMAAGATEVEPGHVHVYVKVFVWLQQRGIEITMLDAIAATTLEMAGPAGGPGALPHIFGNRGQINWRKNFIPEFSFLIRWIATGCGEFFVFSRGVVADKTVYIFLVGKIKGIILPSITGMTAGAPAPVRFNSNSEIVENVFLANPLLQPPLCLPGPVIGLLHLLARLVMTAQAGPGHVLGLGKGLVQHFELGVVRCGCIHCPGQGRTEQAKQGNTCRHSEQWYAEMKTDFSFLFHHPLHIPLSSSPTGDIPIWLTNFVHLNII